MAKGSSVSWMSPVSARSPRPSWWSPSWSARRAPETERLSSATPISSLTGMSSPPRVCVRGNGCFSRRTTVAQIPIPGNGDSRAIVGLPLVTSELTQDCLDAHHRGGTQRHRNLVQIAEQSGRQPGEWLRPTGPGVRPFVVAGLRRGLSVISRWNSVASIPETSLVTTPGGTLTVATGVVQRPLDERLSAGAELSLGAPVGTDLDHGDLHQGRPLQLRCAASRDA